VTIGVKNGVGDSLILGVWVAVGGSEVDGTMVEVDVGVDGQVGVGVRVGVSPDQTAIID
jgi:hypothetical protein